MFKEKLTRADEHNPNDFVYLVHTLMDRNRDGNGVPFSSVRDKIGKIKDPNQFYSASLIGSLDAESAKRRLGYEREVCQLGTFGHVGLVLNPAADDIVYVAWNCDIGSPDDSKELEGFAVQHKGKILSPCVLLTDTRGNASVKYNEMIVRGDENTDITGVFYRTDFWESGRSDGERLRENVREVLQEEVPFIELPKLPIPGYDEITDPEEKEFALVQMARIGSLQVDLVQYEFLYGRDNEPEWIWG